MSNVKEWKPFCLNEEQLQISFKNFKKDKSLGICIVCGSSLSSTIKLPVSTEIVQLKQRISKVLRLDESYFMISKDAFGFCRKCFEDVEKLIRNFNAFCKVRERIKECSSQICQSILLTHLNVQNSQLGREVTTGHASDKNFKDVPEFIDWNKNRVLQMLSNSNLDDLLDLEGPQYSQHIGLEKSSTTDEFSTLDKNDEDTMTKIDEECFKSSNDNNIDQLENAHKIDDETETTTLDNIIPNSKRKRAAIANSKKPGNAKKKKVKNLQENDQFNCDICEKKFKSFPSLRAHKKVHLREGIGSDGSYNCTHCDKIFSDVSSLNDHKNKHKAQQDFCPICRKIFSKGTLPSHLQKHYMKDPIISEIACNICSKMFESPLTLANHLVVHKGDFSCKITSCKKSFSSLSNLHKHEVVHLEENSNSSKLLFDCDFCLELFQNSTDLEKHISSHMESFYKKKFLCDNCGLHFISKSSLKEHIRAVHATGEFVCKVCEKIFGSKRRLTIHQRIHDEGNALFSCAECKLSFNQKILLDKHMRHHSGIMPYKCTHCDHPGFSYAKGLRQHLFKEHSDKMASVKKHICQICYKNFSSEVELEQHSLFHENLKCKICGKQFKMLTHLKEHTLRHADIRPYKCPHCPGKGYIRKKQLADHLEKAHSSEIIINVPAGEMENIAYVIQLP